MRKALGRSNDDGSDPITTDTNKPIKSKRSKKEKLPDNVYKPGEPMPRPKYRGPYNQAHQDKLSAFSFGDAWKRRRSGGTVGSEMSPMGSRIMSRRNSVWSKKSKLGSRQNSAFAGVEESGEGDDDVLNGMDILVSRKQGWMDLVDRADIWWQWDYRDSIQRRIEDQGRMIALQLCLAWSSRRLLRTEMFTALIRKRRLQMVDRSLRMNL